MNVTRTSIQVMTLDEDTRITLADLCQVCDRSADELIAMVEEGLLRPTGATPRQWRFPAADLIRVQVALRLQRDLGVNLAGAALVVELLEERRALYQRLQWLERLTE